MIDLILTLTKISLLLVANLADHHHQIVQADIRVLFTFLNGYSYLNYLVVILLTIFFSLPAGTVPAILGQTFPCHSWVNLSKSC